MSAKAGICVLIRQERKISMKKFVPTVIAVVVVVCAAVGLITLRETNQVMAEDMESRSEAEAITVKNSTPFEIRSVQADFDLEKTETAENIAPGEEATVQIPEDMQNISTVKVEGVTRDGKSFVNTFNGLITDDMTVIISLDEEMNLNVSSNLVE